MVSRVDDILRMDLDEDDGDWVEYGELGPDASAMPTPYQSYGDEERESGKPPKRANPVSSASADKTRVKSSTKKTSSTIAPKSASSTGNFSVGSFDSDGMGYNSTATSLESRTAMSPVNFSSTEGSGRPKSASRRRRGDKEDDRLASSLHQMNLYEGFTGGSHFSPRK